MDFSYSDVANFSQVCLKAGKLWIFPSCCARKLVQIFFADFRVNNIAKVCWAVIFLDFCFQLVVAKFAKPAFVGDVCFSDRSAVSK